FIFKGSQVHRIPVIPSEESRRFQNLLRDYLIRGYRAGEAVGGVGRAIGFVMTTYRKLASSSITAIERALTLRRERLTGEAAQVTQATSKADVSLDDLSSGGDEQDDLTETISGTKAEEFFASERQLIDRLLTCATRIRDHDEKLRTFLDKVVGPL